ncbi:hypothetical protein [uncultured Campylobacter sp.]|uniref:hypothetical protein n=1 Tax=uncultured Campylobacter sp. TaxID=218934 RepID=UPI002620AA2D|nr:hypothetical protein [uncultured Campylobacter sp.]
MFRVFICLSALFLLACSNDKKDELYYKENLDETKALLLKCYEAELKHHLLPRHEALLKEGGEDFLQECREARRALRLERHHNFRERPQMPLNRTEPL